MNITDDCCALLSRIKRAEKECKAELESIGAQITILTAELENIPAISQWKELNELKEKVTRKLFSLRGLAINTEQALASNLFSEELQLFNSKLDQLEGAINQKLH